MNVAYLILAHNNYEHLTRLIDALNDPGVDFYIHIDLKAKEIYKPQIENAIVIPKRVNVNWGCFSQIKATLSLMEYAIKHSKADYYAFISGSDYPIMKNDFLYNLLKNSNSEFINLRKAPSPQKPAARFEYYYFELNRRNKSLKDRILKYTEAFLRKINIKKRIPFELYAGSQWFVLSRACIEYILKTVQVDRRYEQFFKTCLVPDESFFQTIIGNSVFKDKVKSALTFTDWNSDDWIKNPPPLPINETHVENFQVLQANGEIKYFFARKFNNESKGVVDLIESTLRK